MDFKGKAIVFDTNIYLNLYRFSPDYAEFMLYVMEEIKENIIVPSVIYYEFKKHNQRLYFERQRSFEKSFSDNVALIKNQKNKFKSSLNRFILGKYPEIDKLLSNVSKKYDEAKRLVEDYFHDHSVLGNLVNTWDTDVPDGFVEKLYKNGNVLPKLSMDDVFMACEKAEERFEREIPPGYKDWKSKRGISSYSDYLWWSEALQYCREKQVSLIVVTDDVKEDWWKQDSSSLRDELYDEFKRKTHQNSLSNDKDGPSLEGFTSKLFFEKYAKDESIEIPDAIDIFTFMTDEDYVESIKDDAFDKISLQLSFSGSDYLDLDSFDHVGDNRIEDWDINSYDLIKYSSEREDDSILYYLTYKINMSSKSFDYWGRDDDTKEVIESDSYEHTVEGEIVVKVTRKVDFCIKDNSDDFEKAEIESGTLKQVDYKDNNYDPEDVI